MSIKILGVIFQQMEMPIDQKFPIRIDEFYRPLFEDKRYIPNLALIRQEKTKYWGLLKFDGRKWQTVGLADEHIGRADFVRLEQPNLRIMYEQIILERLWAEAEKYRK